MWLNSLNPSVKALAICICILFIALVFDPVTPLIFLFFVIILTWSFGKVSIIKWFIYFSPFILIAFGFVWTNVVFSRISPESITTVLWSWGRIIITQEALHTGFSLGLRILCFAALSMMFVLTTKPVHFMLSLMQQCKLPPRIAYGILAGYRFLPLFKDELTILQSAHRVRGIGRAKGIKGQFTQLGRYAIPLLAGAIRKAERTAMAMESKGFTGTKDRTFYCKQQVTIQDWLFVGLLISLLLFSAVVSYHLGYLKLFSGEI